MIKVSIVVPVYNSEKYIKRCIKSLLNQGMNELQIICIDDFSTDNSINLIREFEDSRIEIYSNHENLGAGAAKNIGISKCIGKYTLFVDSDDCLKMGTLETLYNIAEQHGAEVVSFGMTHIYEMNKTVYEEIAWDGKDNTFQCYFQGVDLLEAMISYRAFSTGARNFVLTDILNKSEIRFTEQTMNDDLEFTLYLLYNTKKTVHLNKNLYIYNHRAKGSISNKSYSIEFWAQYYLILNRIHDDLCNTNEFHSGDYIWDYLMSKCVCKYKGMTFDEKVIFKDYVSKQSVYFNRISEFASYNCYVSQYYLVDDAIINKLKLNVEFYIYGAGDYAGDLFCVLQKYGLGIKGFVVSGNKKNNLYYNNPVYNLDEISDVPCTFVLGVSKRYVNEIENLLYSKGHEVINLL